jgi:hypothetical protein
MGNVAVERRQARRAEQVIVTMKDGDRRALSSVLQNVFDAWMALLGQGLPPINEF